MLCGEIMKRCSQSSCYSYAYVRTYVQTPTLTTPTPPPSDDLPPVPLYGLVLISTGAAIIIVLLVIFIVLLTRYCYTLRKKKRQYKFNSGECFGVYWYISHRYSKCIFALNYFRYLHKNYKPLWNYTLKTVSCLK